MTEDTPQRKTSARNPCAVSLLLGVRQRQQPMASLEKQGEMEVWPGLYAHLTSQLMALAWGKVVLVLEVWPGLYTHLTSQLMALVWGKVVLVLEVWPGLYTHLTSQLMALAWGKVVLVLEVTSLTSPKHCGRN
ncbi:uncharacterized protein LOC126994817 isoform X3 [Eriocheir sinensis]|uniref:uncharacterized protein LOC126994817 isoform X3 n=1 Tax=Eriocheir sinensis TaxID=95602 RepID=UPI0021C5ABEC|nr:uncharacterized protein LOC126994817 isoform X3 [Eriocheir sinensis]